MFYGIVIVFHITKFKCYLRAVELVLCDHLFDSFLVANAIMFIC